MLVFLDFEASSLAKHGYPIEVGWIFEDGTTESHLIRPAAGWDDWDASAEAIHHISRTTLERDGEPHDFVARRMVETLSGHDLLASAPSWDGKWLSALLRAAGLPRHTLRLRDSDDVILETAHHAFAAVVPERDAAVLAQDLVSDVRTREVPDVPAHRALADAVAARQLWLTVRSAAEEAARTLAAQ